MTTNRIDRRLLLQSGIALSTVAVAGASLTGETAPATQGRPSAELRLARFVVDRRLPVAVAAAAAARADGTPVDEVDGDMSRLWYDGLDLAWRRAPMTLAGVTAPEGLFVLETLAADRGMRVVYRGQHAMGAGGASHHELQGPGRLVATVASCLSFGSVRFGASAYGALAHCPAGRGRIESFSTGVEPEVRNAAAARSASFVTWIIAPRGSAAALRPA
jgi:hypothetical protein